MNTPYSVSHNQGAAGMAASHSAPVSDPLTGKAAELSAYTRGMEGRYAPPVVAASGDNNEVADNGGNTLPDYNLWAAPPTKYSRDTQLKQAFRDKESIIAGIEQKPADYNKQQVQRVVTVGPEEVAMMRESRSAAELADFDQYVWSLVDPRQPGSFKWLNEVYPEFVSRRIEQVQTDFEYALRNKLIDQWGINDFEDLRFKYLVDQGVLEGPELHTRVAQNSQYHAGYLSPWNFLHRFHMEKDDGKKSLKLPFSSATEGRRPNANTEWSIKNQFLSSGRDTRTIAQEMYAPSGTGGSRNSITLQEFL